MLIQFKSQKQGIKSYNEIDGLFFCHNSSYKNRDILQLSVLRVYIYIFEKYHIIIFTGKVIALMNSGVPEANSEHISSNPRKKGKKQTAKKAP